MTLSKTPLDDPEEETANAGIDEPEEDGLEFDEPVEDSDDELDIINDADDEPDDEDIPMVVATENRR